MNNYFSIIIPYYNREDYLYNTLRSILNQTYRPIQLILVDNNSTDNSNKIVSNFKETFENETFQIVLTNENIQTAGAARNKGLLFATGNYLTFFDSDDIMSKKFIESLYHKFEANQLLDVVFVRTILMRGNIELPRKVFYNHSIIDQILTGMISTQSFGIKTSYLNKIGNWNADLKIWIDLELGVRILINSPKYLWIKSQNFNKIKLHDESITGSNFTHSFPERLQSLEFIKQEVSKADIPHKKRIIAAIKVRKVILSAQVAREFNPEGKKLFRSILRATPFIYRPFYMLIYFQTYLSIPGSWYVARLILKIGIN